MENMKLNFKTIIVLATILFTCGGFYYTTQTRLDAVEKELLFLQRQVGQMQKDIKRLDKVIVRHSKQYYHNK